MTNRSKTEQCFMCGVREPEPLKEVRTTYRVRYRCVNADACDTRSALALFIARVT